MNDITLVLDAMGVIYTAADDVAELLIPFLREHGSVADVDTVTRNYTLASLGEIDPDTFWSNVGVSPDLEGKYLSAHRLTAGLTEFLGNLPSSVSSVWCLSNDVGRWSRILRESHGLDRFFASFIISGDIGSRKPTAAIYQSLLNRTQRPPQSHVFVDDRRKNLDAACALGFRTVYFGPAPENPESVDGHVRARSFSVLWEYLNGTA